MGKKYKFINNEEYYAKMVDAINQGIMNIWDETNEVRSEITIQALKDILEHQIRRDQEIDITNYILEQRIVDNNILFELVRLISNRVGGVFI